MKTDLRLYIGDKEVEFSADPKILYNYKETELHNPTIVRNGWSKTISIDSTPQNDDIFNHFWNLQRTQFGADFNAMVKAPFTLYNNGEIVESGYVKLNSLKTSNHKTTYEIQLFSKVGDFFYNLSYDQLSDSDRKKDLASLKYITDEQATEPDLDFNITKETIAEAWDTLLYRDIKDKWQVINFCPTIYNGIPNDFDAGKVLVNCSGTPQSFQKGSRVDGVDYLPVLNGSFTTNGYVLGTTSEPLTADECFDLRSYLQRPVVSINRILTACFQPENNGGYQVKADQRFFNVNNPYWGYQSNVPWMTLGMIRDLDTKGEDATTISDGEFDKQNINKWVLNYGASLAKLNNVRVRVNVTYNPDTTTATTLYPYRRVDVSNANTLNNKYVLNYTENGVVICQLLARDMNGKICASSKAYVLGQSEKIAGKSDAIFKDFWKEGTEFPKPSEYVFLKGRWVKSGSTYYFCDENGIQKDIEFTFDTDSPISVIEMRTEMSRSTYTNFKGIGSNWNASFDPNSSYIKMWTGTTATASGRITQGQAASGGTTGDFSFEVTDFEAIATTYESLFSGRRITKEQLLSTDFTPCDVLLSYAKLFGLYFYYDPTETPDDPERYPSGVIHIMDRHTFYTGEVVDIEKDIDRSKDMTIIPTNATTKWYAFNLEQVESDCEQAYEETYGNSYARQLVNTGYNFDKSTTDLYEGNVFKGGIMVREKDKYFVYPHFNIPSYVYNGFTYELYALGDGEGYDSVEITAKTKSALSSPINSVGLPYYDILPKLQCHSKDNSPTDGAGVLLFYRQGVETYTPNGTLNYWLTDDILEMGTLNGGSPCWLWTNGEYDGAHNQIAIKVNNLPFFTRDIINFGVQEGNIVHSWNFGHPLVTFTPNTYTTSGDCIYDKCWRDYCHDMYDVDNRRVTAYVLLHQKPGQDVLRKWYYFDGCYWRLNAVSDWNLGEENPVKCEFIKVIDTANYDVAQIVDQGIETITLEPQTIPCSGGVVTMTIYLQAGGHWVMGDGISGYDPQGNRFGLSSEDIASQTAGGGQYSEVTLTFPAIPSAATGQISWDIGIEDDGDNWTHATLYQEYCGPAIRISSSPTIDATATTLSYSVITTDPNGCSVRLSSAALPQDLTNTHPSGETHSSFTIPANTTPAIVYYGLYATTADQSNQDYASVEQGGAGGAYVTGISFSNFTWTTDVPATGGTASSANCSFSVVANLSDGTSTDITNDCDFSSSTTLAVPATTATTRESVGVINVIADYRDANYNPFSTTIVTYVYQAAAVASTTWTAYNRSTLNVYGNLFTGNSVSYAGLEVHSGTTQAHYESVPATITSAWLAINPVPANPSDYTIILSDSNVGSSFICTYNGSAWVNDSSTITLQQGSILDIAIPNAPAPTPKMYFERNYGTASTLSINYTFKQNGTTIKTSAITIGSYTTPREVEVPELGYGPAVLTDIEIVPDPRLSNTYNISVFTYRDGVYDGFTCDKETFTQYGETWRRWYKHNQSLQFYNGETIYIRLV